MKIALFWAMALLVLSVEAVKEYLFKDCLQSGFCFRNRHYASRISAQGASKLPYSIDSATISVTESCIRGVLTKQLPSQGSVDFSWEISVLVGDSIRFKVDEDRSQVLAGKVNPKRYDEAISAAFDTLPRSKTLPLVHESVKSEKSSVSYSFGPENAYQLVMDFSPVKLTVYKQGQAQIVVNENSFLNIEQSRTEKDNAAQMNRDLESDFDMFRDSFDDSKADTKPLGPESVAVDVTFPGVSHVYGIPEHADSLSLQDTSESKWPYRLFNVDIFEYETDSRMPMYGLIPLLVGVRPDSAVGVFWANSADTFVDVRKGASVRTHWMSENGVLDMVLVLGDKPVDVTRKYGLLSGYTPLPQEFALGYHQCRWNYNDVEDVLDIASKMDLHLFPFDTMWLDIEYADHKKYFTWDPSRFGESTRMLQELDTTGRNLVVIIDPHLKTGYYVSNHVEKSGLAIKDASNDTYKGHCWPGESLWIDLMNPLAQAYWDELFAASKKLFLHELLTNVHLWNDMNEPSVFNGPESSSPRDNLHYGDWEHRSVHNLWGKTFHELTHKSLEKRQAATSRQRPFILTRSYYAGSQRTAAMWTGDNRATWEFLRASVPMVLTSNVVNMPFAGADVGGFFGDPSKELLTRWYQAGIWYPFFRAHAHIDSRRREPWIPGEPYTSIMRDAVRLRYALLPTLYTLFHETSINGLPIWKPMFYEYPADEETYEIEDQFFLGDSGLLVKPVVEEACHEVSVYIPQDEVFYDYTNGKFPEQPRLQQTGYISRKVELNDIPVFLKGGSILARRDRYRRSSKLMRKDPFTLVVAFGQTGSALGKLYMDDGESYDYKEGKFVEASFEATEGRCIKGVSSTGDSTYSASLRSVLVERITIAGAIAHGVKKVTVKQNNQTWEARFKVSGNLIELLNPGINIVDDWSVEMSGSEQVSHDEL